MYESKETMAAVKFAKKFLSTPVLLNDAKASTPQEHENVIKALKQAAINPDNPDTNDFDALVLIAGTSLSLHGILPQFLASFAADVLLGKRKRPTKRGPDKYLNFGRDYKLWRATQEVAKAFGLPHYTNNELSDKTTAAEIVSRATGCKPDVVITAYKKFGHSCGAKNYSLQETDHLISQLQIVVSLLGRPKPLLTL